MSEEIENVEEPVVADEVVGETPTEVASEYEIVLEK